MSDLEKKASIFKWLKELMLATDTGVGEQRSSEVNKERRIAPDYLDTMTGWLREQLRLAR